MWAEVHVSSFNLHYPITRLSLEKQYWCRLRAWKQRTLNRKWQSCRHSAYCRFPFHQRHMKNAFRTFPPVVSALRWLCQRSRCWLLGVFISLCYVLFCYRPFTQIPMLSFVSDQSHLRRRNLYWLDPVLRPIWEQPCVFVFFLSSAVRSASVQCTLMDDSERLHLLHAA